MDWVKVLHLEVPGEVYSKVVRRINHRTGREKNFPVKDDIKNIIRDDSCEYKFLFGGTKESSEDGVEWICVDDGEKTKIRGYFYRGLEDGKRVTKLADFEVFSEGGELTARVKRIKERLVLDYSGVVKFFANEEIVERVASVEREKRRLLSERILSEFSNPDVKCLVRDISSDTGINEEDIVLMLSRYKGMSSRERHWVTFGHRIEKYVNMYGLGTSDIKLLFDRIHKAGV